MMAGDAEGTKALAVVENARYATAIDELIGGASVTEAAAKAGYTRETLSRLIHKNVIFQAELNRRRHEARDAITGKLNEMIGRISEAVQRALVNPETPPGVVLQSGLSALPKLYALMRDQEVGSVDVEKLAQKIALSWSIMADTNEINGILRNAQKEIEKV
jgi:phage terminase small subunit